MSDLSLVDHHCPLCGNLHGPIPVTVATEDESDAVALAALELASDALEAVERVAETAIAADVVSDLAEQETEQLETLVEGETEQTEAMTEMVETIAEEQSEEVIADPEPEVEAEPVVEPESDEPGEGVETVEPDGEATDVTVPPQLTESEDSPATERRTVSRFAARRAHR